MSNSKSFKEGRNDDTGRFVSVETARRDPSNHSVEHIPKQGEGDTGRYDKKK